MISCSKFVNTLVLWITDFIMTERRPPQTKGGRGLNAKAYSDLSESDTEISFVSSDRPSIERLSPTVYDFTDSGRTSRLSTSSDQSFQSIHLDAKFSDLSFLHDISSFSQESGRTSCSWSSQNLVKTFSS